MQTPIIVMGAAGRMGTVISRMVKEDPALALAGRVEHESRLAGLSPVAGCVDGNDVETVLAAVGEKAVVIDFTAPALSLSVARAAVKRGAAHVVGTTGFAAEEMEELRSLAKKTPLFWTPNMSVGVTVFAKILPQLVRMLGEDYDLEIMEIHHNKKKDSPSGTALRLAEALAEGREWDVKDSLRFCREGIVGERPHKEIGVQAIRGGDVAGVHTAYFLGNGERLEVTHHAHSRDNFAQGALRAAKWLAKQEPGALYSMNDLL